MKISQRILKKLSTMPFIGKHIVVIVVVKEKV